LPNFDQVAYLVLCNELGLLLAPLLKEGGWDFAQEIFGSTAASLRELNNVNNGIVDAKLICVTDHILTLKKI
jgi:hypothetical protein